MEFSATYSAVALTAVIGKLSYNTVSHWWKAKSLRDIYIGRAASIQNLHEVVNDSEDGETTTEVEDLLDKGAKGKAVRKKAQFRNHLVQQGQAKFGCPTRNEANRLVVRKYLHDVCVDHGLLARHINDHIDIATELVFVPSRSHLTALAITHTELSKVRMQVSNDLGGPRATVA